MTFVAQSLTRILAHHDLTLGRLATTSGSDYGDLHRTARGKSVITFRALLEDVLAALPDAGHAECMDLLNAALLDRIHAEVGRFILAQALLADDPARLHALADRLRPAMDASLGGRVPRGARTVPIGVGDPTALVLWLTTEARAAMVRSAVAPEMVPIVTLDYPAGRVTVAGEVAPEH